MMRAEEIDRILSGNNEIIPSSGFASAVMEAVEQEASAPPPIPFPWKLAALGMAASVLALALSTVVLPPGPAGSPSSALAVDLLEAANAMELGWIALALLLSLAPVKLARLLAGDRR